MRVCTGSGCGKRKSEDQFHSDRVAGLTQLCASCRKKQCIYSARGRARKKKLAGTTNVMPRLHLGGIISARALNLVADKTTIAKARKVDVLMRKEDAARESQQLIRAEINQMLGAK